MLRKALAAMLLVNVLAAVPMLPRLIDGLDGASIGSFTSAWAIQTGEAMAGFLDEAATSRVVMDGDTPRVGGLDARELDLTEHEVGRALGDDAWVDALVGGEDGGSALDALRDGTFGAEDG